MKSNCLSLLVILTSVYGVVLECAAEDETRNATRDLLQREAEELSMVGKKPGVALTVAADYFGYDLDLAPGGQTGLSQGFGAGRMQGDLFGSSVAFNVGRLYVDGAFRLGTIKGDISYGNASSFADVDRKEAEVRLTLRKGSDLFGAKGLGGWIGGSYTYINQEFVETLPVGLVWTSTGERSRSYDDQFHMFLGEAGVQYTILLKDSDALRIRLIPKAGGGLGGGQYGQDTSNPSVDTSLWQLAFKWQATVQLEFTFSQRHTLFLEGGYKRVGFWQSEGETLSQDYFGPYARAGYSFAF